MKGSGRSAYPVLLDLRDRSVLLVGGGSVAFRKARALWETGCRLTVVAPDLSDSFQAWLEDHPCRVERRAYRAGEGAAYVLVICATDHPDVNRRVFEDAREAGRLVNVVDRPDLCNVQMPARVKRGDLQVAISTGGRCPAYARWLREELEEVLSHRHGLLLDRLASIRAQVRETVRSGRTRRRILFRILRSEATRRFLAGDERYLARMERGWNRARRRLP